MGFICVCVCVYIYTHVYIYIYICIYTYIHIYTLIFTNFSRATNKTLHMLWLRVQLPLRRCWSPWSCAGLSLFGSV